MRTVSGTSADPLRIAGCCDCTARYGHLAAVTALIESVAGVTTTAADPGTPATADGIDRTAGDSYCSAGSAGRPTVCSADPGAIIAGSIDRTAGDNYRSTRSADLTTVAPADPGAIIAGSIDRSAGNRYFCTISARKSTARSPDPGATNAFGIDCTAGNLHSAAALPIVVASPTDACAHVGFGRDRSAIDDHSAAAFSVVIKKCSAADSGAIAATPAAR